MRENGVFQHTQLHLEKGAGAAFFDKLSPARVQHLKERLAKGRHLGIKRAVVLVGHPEEGGGFVDETGESERCALRETNGLDAAKKLGSETLLPPKRRHLG
ncbi:MAG: hypothetical protein EBS01_03815 [Verrucomicrobia bacterium]|nr:hypothetical protein [Verrucomicrobiota bacterium]